MASARRLLTPSLPDLASLVPRRATAAIPYRTLSRLDVALIALPALLATVVASALAERADAIYGYGDAASHLYIARRVLDSQTPGFAQLGTNWLPGLHLLLQPFVHFQPLLTSGLAGAIPSGAAYVIAVVAIADTAVVLSGRRNAGFLAAAVMVANPSLLYLAAVPMTEVLMVASLAVTADMFARWLRQGGTGQLMMVALSAAVATTLRYEGWMLVAVVAGLVVVWASMRDRSPLSPVRAESLAVAVAAPGAFVAMLWMLYNWLIFGSPLEFATGEFSSAFVVAQFGEIPTEGDFIASMLAYGSATLLIGGVVMIALAVAALLLQLWRQPAGPWLFVVLLLMTPVPFNVLAMYNGSSLIWTPHNVGQYFNVRYGALMLPAVALLAGLAAGIPITRARRRSAARRCCW